MRPKVLAFRSLKFKVAHKRADTDTWSASDGAQRKRFIKFLSEVIESLEKHDTETGKAPAKRKPSAQQKPRTLKLNDARRAAAVRKAHTSHRAKRAA